MMLVMKDIFFFFYIDPRIREDDEYIILLDHGRLGKEGGNE